MLYMFMNATTGGQEGFGPPNKKKFGRTPQVFMYRFLMNRV